MAAKAINKTTGKMVTVTLEYPDCNGTGYWRDEEHKCFYREQDLDFAYNETVSQDYIEEVRKAVNKMFWEKRRYEIAKDVLHALRIEIGRKEIHMKGFKSPSMETQAVIAVNLSNALVKELKKQNI